MNNVMLIGRLTRDPEVRYTSGSQMAVANFTLAIDRPFPPCCCVRPSGGKLRQVSGERKKGGSRGKDPNRKL